MPSLLRGFSAPVKLDAGYADDELGLPAGPRQRPVQALGRRPAAGAAGAAAAWSQGRRPGARGRRSTRACPTSFAAVLDRAAEDPAFAARALQLPERRLSRPADGGDRRRRHRVRRCASPREQLGGALRERWLAAYLAQPATEGPFSIETAAMARRALKNLALAYLALRGRRGGPASCAWRQFADADNMTDSLAALRLIAETGMPEIGRARWPTSTTRWQNEPLVVNKWFSLQAVTRGRGERSSGSRRLTGPSGLHAGQPEPGPRGARHVRDDEPARASTAATAPATGCWPTRCCRARPPEPAGRRPPAHRPRPLAPLRPGSPGTDAGRAGAGGGDARAVARTATRSRASRWRGKREERRRARRAPGPTGSVKASPCRSRT